MNPNEQARDAGLHAVEQTRLCLDHIEEAMEAGDWSQAGQMYMHIGKLCDVGTRACRKITVTLARRN